MKLINNIKILIWGVVSSLCLTSCLGSSEEAETITTNYYNAIVTEFSLADNSEVATKLSDYEFTIDNFGLSDAAIHAKFPHDGIIFNADSLPFGSIPDSVMTKVSVSAPDSVFYQLYAADGTLKQYSAYNTDSALYFASYPDARLTVSARGNRKTYHIKINVHKVAGDTILYHDYTGELWANTPITDQRTDTIGSMVYWLVENGIRNQVIISDLSTSCQAWSEAIDVNVEGGELLDLKTLYSWHKALYAIGKTSGALLTSTDGYNWETANSQFEFANILGNQLATRGVDGKWNKDTLTAIIHFEDSYHFAVSADAKTWRIDKIIPRNFPVRGFSRPVSVNARPNTGNITSRIYIMGGMMADGRTLSSSTWSCDGYNKTAQCCNWAEFTHQNMPAMQDGTLLEYTTDSDNPKSLWIMHPGFIADGSIKQETHYGRTYATLYYSEDSGVSWRDLYTKYPKLTDNSAYADIAPNSVICNPKNYEIYYFGGRRKDGTFCTKVWGGLLPSLSFKKVR